MADLNYRHYDLLRLAVLHDKVTHSTATKAMRPKPVKAAYHSLGNKLEKAGYLQVHDTDRHGNRTYRITSSGKEALKVWDASKQ